MQVADTGTHEHVSLDAVISTYELKRRPPRSSDHAAENRALVALAQAMVNSPRELLQKLADVALDLCHAGSAGISIIEQDGDQQIFRWHALAGELASHLGGTTPRYFSPCGTVVDLNAVQLMSRLERHYRYFQAVKPQIVEALLVPFTVAGRTIGTIWIVAHTEERKFDAEDERLMTDLGKFAAAAYQLRLALEGSKDADRRKDEFLATVAHELRNPLAAARTACQYVRARLHEVPDPQLQLMSDVGQRQLISMSRMVDDLLDMARIRLDKIELRKELVAVDSFVQQGVELSRSHINTAQHELTIALPPERLCVEGDPMRLSQIVSNLLNNAAKYTPDGGRIEVSAVHCNGELALRICDNGIGISDLMLSRIFNLYAQVDTACKRAQGGLGIGLTLVRRLVELHGGQIEARSNGPGTGSEFTVRLPLAVDTPQILSPIEKFGSEPDYSCRPLRILVVDDNTDAADSLVLLLRTEGHDVRAVYDGVAALETSCSFKPEVTLQDIGMPGMNGLEVARKLRKLPHTRDAILIALTGHGTGEDEEETRSAGFDHHLVKPVDFEALIQLLRSISQSPVTSPMGRLCESKVRTILRLPHESRLSEKATQVH